MVVDYSQPPKMVHFNGANSLEWVLLVERYFFCYSVSNSLKLPLASFFIEGEAREWFRSLYCNNEFRDWDHFVDELFIRFRNPTCESLTVAEIAPTEATEGGSSAATMVSALDDAQPTETSVEDRQSSHEHQMFAESSERDESSEFSQIVTLPSSTVPFATLDVAAKMSEPIPWISFTNSYILPPCVPPSEYKCLTIAYNVFAKMPAKYNNKYSVDVGATSRNTESMNEILLVDRITLIHVINFLQLPFDPGEFGLPPIQFKLWPNPSNMLPGLDEGCGNGMKHLVSQSNLAGNGKFLFVWDPGVSFTTMKLNKLSSGILFRTWTHVVLVNAHQQKKPVCTFVVNMNGSFLVSGGIEKRVVPHWKFQKIVPLQQAVHSRVYAELMTIPSWLNQLLASHHIISLQFDPGVLSQDTKLYLFRDSEDHKTAQVQSKGMQNAQQPTCSTALAAFVAPQHSLDKLGHNKSGATSSVDSTLINSLEKAVSIVLAHFNDFRHVNTFTNRLILNHFPFDPGTNISIVSVCATETDLWVQTSGRHVEYMEIKMFEQLDCILCSAHCLIDFAATWFSHVPKFQMAGEVVDLKMYVPATILFVGFRRLAWVDEIVLIIKQPALKDFQFIVLGCIVLKGYDNLAYTTPERLHEFGNSNTPSGARETHEIGVGFSLVIASQRALAEKKETKLPTRVLHFAINSKHKLFDDVLSSEVMLSLFTLDAESFLQSSKAIVHMWIKSPNDEIWSQYTNKLTVGADYHSRRTYLHVSTVSRHIRRCLSMVWAKFVRFIPPASLNFKRYATRGNNPILKEDHEVSTLSKSVNQGAHNGFIVHLSRFHHLWLILAPADMEVNHEMARLDIYVHQNNESLRLSQLASSLLWDYISVPSILSSSVAKALDKDIVVGIDNCALLSDGEMKYPSVLVEASAVKCQGDGGRCIIFHPLDITLSHGWTVLDHDATSAIGSNRFNALMTTKDFIWESFTVVQANAIALVLSSVSLILNLEDKVLIEDGNNVMNVNRPAKGMDGKLENYSWDPG